MVVFLHDYKYFYLIVGFKQNHVVFTEHSQENDRGHVLETVNPFSSLGSLSAYVHHSVRFKNDGDY